MRHVGVKEIVGVAPGNDEIAQRVGYVANGVRIQRVYIFFLLNLELIGVHVRCELGRPECPYAFLLVHLAFAEIAAKREPHFLQQALVLYEVADNIDVVGLIRFLRLFIVFIVILLIIVIGLVDGPQHLGR